MISHPCRPPCVIWNETINTWLCQNKIWFFFSRFIKYIHNLIQSGWKQCQNKIWFFFSRFIKYIHNLIQSGWKQCEKNWLVKLHHWNERLEQRSGSLQSPPSLPDVNGWPTPWLIKTYFSSVTLNDSLFVCLPGKKRFQTGSVCVDRMEFQAVLHSLLNYLFNHEQKFLLVRRAQVEKDNTQFMPLKLLCLSNICLLKLSDWCPFVI